MSKWLAGRVVGQKHWTDRLLSLQVAAPLGPFQAGQFVKLALDAGGERVARPYSFVNPPGSEPHEFYYNIVARGDVSPAGLAAKARWVLDMMSSRLRGLGASWDLAGVTQVYTVHDFHPLVREIAARAGASTLVWHYCRPPIAEIEFEMDVRGVSVERMLA